MSTELGTTEGMEPRELVHFVTQQTRFSLIISAIKPTSILDKSYVTIGLYFLRPSTSRFVLGDSVPKQLPILNC